jgi:TonB family protein
MLATTAFLILSTVTAAVPTAPFPWFEFHDYPNKAFQKHWEGVTRFELLVDPRGRVANCTVTQSSGHEDLDRTTCALASFRARFAPARGADGEPVYGVYRSQAVWVIPEDSLSNTDPGADLQVSLNKLPEGTAKPAAVKLAYVVDAQGQVSDCAALRGAPAQPQALVELACREVKNRLAPQPVKAPNGQSVAAVRTAAVEFTTE